MHTPADHPETPHADGNDEDDAPTELDRDEGADAFETPAEADTAARETHAHSDAPRDDLPHINVDTPD